MTAATSRTRSARLEPARLSVPPRARIEPLTRIERVAYPLRRGRSSQLSYKGLAAGQGVEPRLAGPEPAVLPLDDPASRAEGATRTRKPRGLSSRRPPIAFTAARCAARGSNPVPSGKSRVHHRKCLRRLVEMARLERAAFVPPDRRSDLLSHIPAVPHVWIEPTSPGLEDRCPAIGPAGI